MSLPTVVPETTGVDAGSVRLGARRWAGARRWPGARRWTGASGRPVLLVHGLSSNARLWDLVAGRLAAAGHPVLAVDLRGHGSSAAVADGSTDPTSTAAADLAAVCSTEGWTAPVVAGQSWGGNVVLQLAVDRPELVHGLVLVDGGWLHLGDRFDDLDAAWQVLAPPRLTGLPAPRLRERLAQAHPGWPPEQAPEPLIGPHLAQLITDPDRQTTPGERGSGGPGGVGGTSGNGPG